MERYTIDDTDRIRPHIRLSHMILREGLGTGLKSIVLEAAGGAMPCARAQKDGKWEVMMAFPAALYGSLTSYLCEMAGITHSADPAGGTINVNLDGRPASVALVARGDEDGFVEITLLFPTARVTAAT